MREITKLKFKELTKSTWNDFEKLFGERGACGGCWCMYWRLRKKDFEAQKGESNKVVMKDLVEQKEMIGLIAYLNKEPIGWCSVAPRENFIRLANSRVLKPVDDKPVWSIVCFFIDKEYRKQGYSVELLKGVIEFCQKLSEAQSRSAGKEAVILEGYPTEPYNENIPPAFAWTGLPSAFIKAGFKEIARRSKARPIMRYYL
ncbi:MAG: GNAT family N-acetyltransferase [Ignavibacteria bacterium]|jgi:GNAT superfamily N-acetyltransferase